jgi:hypothetical protein
MSRQFIKACCVSCAIISLCFAACLFLGFLSRRSRGYKVVSELQCGTNGTVIIYRHSGEACEWFSYNVRTPVGVTRMRNIGLRFDREPLEFELIRSTDDTLIAVVERRHYSSVLVLHDFATGRSWPLYDGFYQRPDHGSELLEQFHQSSTGELQKPKSRGPPVL